MHALHTVYIFNTNGGNLQMDDNNNEERRPTNAIMAALTPGTHTSIPVSELSTATDLTSRALASETSICRE
jgi:hypothetical protein